VRDQSSPLKAVRPAWQKGSEQVAMAPVLWKGKKPYRDR